ncbi:MAG TPA: hypothetical protein VMV04_22130 [Thermodesulfobacteriota bacterium]|nr:hypothetical protein [Thermodesulfobacteriota bacterium]
MKSLKIHIILALLLFICFIVGCAHGPAPYRPSSWDNTRIDLKSVVDKPDQSLLQVIIVYGAWWCHHSALRLVSPDRPVLFWDPGGSYGTFHKEDIRSKDLIRKDPPDLEAYLQFAWNYSSVEVEVFEWDLGLEHAHELYDVLINGTNKNHPAGKFTTTTMGGFCCVALSDFLHRFATNVMTVPRSYFFPHDLARVLYTQSPKRVLAFRRGKQLMYIPRN